MMYQRIHVLPHVVAVGKYDLRCVGFDRTRSQSLQRLTDYLVRFITLAHPDTETRPDIAVRFDGNIKIVCLISGVRVVASQIEIDSAAAETRPGQSPVDRVFGRYDTNAHRTALPKCVSADERFESVHRLRKVCHELITPPLESRRQVHHQATDTKIARRHTSTRGRFDQVENFFPLTKAVKEDRH